MKKGYKNNVCYTRLLNLYKGFAPFDKVMNAPKKPEKQEVSEGSLAHYLLLEPEKFANVHPYQKFSRQSKSGKEQYKELCESYEYLFCYADIEDYENILLFGENCKKNTAINEILQKSQKELYFKQDIKGLSCSGYLDLLTPLPFGLCNIYDLKFLTYSEFIDIYNMKDFGLQAGIYAVFAEQLGYEVANFQFVCHDDNYNPVLVPVDTYELEQAQKDFYTLLNKINNHLNTDFKNVKAPKRKRRSIYFNN